MPCILAAISHIVMILVANYRFSGSRNPMKSFLRGLNYHNLILAAILKNMAAAIPIVYISLEVIDVLSWFWCQSIGFQGWGFRLCNFWDDRTITAYVLAAILKNMAATVYKTYTTFKVNRCIGMILVLKYRFWVSRIPVMSFSREWYHHNFYFGGHFENMAAGCIKHTYLLT